MNINGMRNIKLTIEYDGTAYHGWQSQANAVTVQDTVAAAINRLTGEKCSVTGSSRTDTGVHALGFVCNFFTASSIPAEKFAFALNTLLPDDVVVRSSCEVPADFHSRFSAKGKKYLYLVYNSIFPPALLRHRAYHVYYPLDIDAMREAAGHFEGTHDFSAFRRPAVRKTMSGRLCKPRFTVAKHLGISLPLPEGNLIRFSVTGTVFFTTW